MKKRSWKSISAKSLTLIMCVMMCFTVVAYAILCGTLGSIGARAGIIANADNYSSKYASKQEAIVAGAALNDRIVEEGMVLLKNENNTLPLLTGATKTKVTLLGRNSHAPQGGGSPDDGDTSGGIARVSTDIYASLKDAGYSTNDDVRAIYKTANVASDRLFYFDAANNLVTTKYEARIAEMRPTYASFNDAAIVVLGNNVQASAQALVDDQTHRVHLDAGQKAIVKEAADNFDKVIVVINSSIPMELGTLHDDPKIGAILLAGEPGNSGFNALGKILNGTVNPSGHLVDMYLRDFNSNPAEANHINRYTNDSGTNRDAYFIDYEESIYVGYRYYETVDADKNDSHEWYNSKVAYPFGYGLSYTTFDWDIVGGTANNAAITASSEISVQVKVTNTGSVAGKEVVQLYYTAPYTNGGIEKSHVVLAGFEKTKLLAAGASETLTIKFDAKDMASYDYNDKNTNSFKGYELEAGDYIIKAMKNSHEVVDSITVKVNEGIKIENGVTGYAVKNQFDDINTVVATRQPELLTRKATSGVSGLLTLPTAPTADEKKLSDADYAKRTVVVDAAYDVDAPWTVDAEDMPNAPANQATRPETASIMAADLIGADYDDERWEELIDQLSINEMQRLIQRGGFAIEGIPYIGLPETFQTDGPTGWNGAGITSGSSALTTFCRQAVLSSTFNKDLAYEYGEMIGEQGLWGSSDVTVGGKTYTGWYAPAMNLHRVTGVSRYTEYYSEDAFLTGIMAANASLGASSKGAFVYIKHFAMHEDGDSGAPRGAMMQNTPAGKAGGTSAWCNEQAMRELYLRAFQISVEKGAVRGAMSSFHRLGHTWAGGSYALLTEVLRNEWGFKGLVITDITLYYYMNGDQMLRAGGDMFLDMHVHGMNLSGVMVISTANLTATQLTAIRKAVKNILYVVVNSNAMQPPVGIIDYDLKLDSVILVDVPYSFNAGGAALKDNITLLNAAYFDLDEYAPTSYGAKGLPTGLTINTKTGMISGTPTEQGVFTVTISVYGKNEIALLEVEREIRVLDYDGLIQELAELRELAETLEGDKTNLNEQITALETAKTALETSKAALEAEKAALEAEKAALEAEKAALQEEIDALKADKGCKSEVNAIGGSIAITLTAIALLGACVLLKKRKMD